ncbi:hypothetical protein FR932_07105 [Moritella marina ATCC 15381]|uniref:Polysaccharide lyase 14 domain-containing protein n=1 Tax=Moritella marina ATCC 15381 TaxID=1202962 RepID=A0A5J6WHU6_MORMI|nr:hypothetical protein [Moritella marina]QFI37627.1 hypothetical protein FR932_07105 [Moritella marina ATCC 15381]
MKKLLLCIFTGTFLVACGGSSSNDDNTQTVPVPVPLPVPDPIPDPDPTPDPGPTDPSQIHDVVPNVDYNNAQGIIDSIDFENQQNGEYTSSMFNSDFNNEWGSVTGRANIITMNGSNKLAVTHPKDTYKEGISAGKELNEYNELYFSYQINFGKDYDFSMGGKIPGLAGLNPNVDKKPDGCSTVGEDEGFSLRSMFRENGRAIGYFYHQDKTKTCGDEIDYQHEGKNFSFKREKTYLIEQYVKMNDAHQANGIVTIHVNGFKVLERKNMTFSESGIHAINYQFTQLWHGGNDDKWAVDRDSTAYLDHFTLSSKPLSFSK